MIPGADVDSSARDPPPQCHPGTREWLTKAIQEWFLDEKRAWDMLWLHGPAGVGKSAVAQSVAEYAAENNRLGAAFFFSRTSGRSDYARVWITIVYQLAVRIPEYHTLVARQLAADPDILRKAPHVQFKRLLVQPLAALSPRPKILIVLDGLDECEGEDAQLNIIELINNLIRSTPSFPVVWMVCSRLEYHLKRLFADNDFTIQCWRKELPIDSEESEEDVALFLRDSFREIRRKYSDIVDGSWPLERDISVVIGFASGLFAFASALVRYVRDPQYRNPPARLRALIQFLSSHRSDEGNPMQTLDLLYAQVLSEIHPDILPMALRILHTSYTNIMEEPAIVVANVYGITRDEFYSALSKLHSVLDVPLPRDAASRPVKILHQSFADYLWNPNRSIQYHRDVDTIASDLLRRSFTLASSTSFQIPGLVSRGDLSAVEVPLSWEPSNINDLAFLKRKLLQITGNSIIWPLHLQRYDENTFKILRTFNYNAIANAQWLGKDEYTHDRNKYFCQWLVSAVRLPSPVPLVQPQIFPLTVSSSTF